MKKPGIPEIEDSSDSGSDGVSVPGEGALWGARAFSEDEPVTPVAPVAPAPLAGPFDFPRAGVVAGVALCGCWPWTCGAAAVPGAAEPAGAGAGSAVEPAGEVVRGSGAGAELVVSLAGFAVVPAPSSARLTAGAASATAAKPGSSRLRSFGRRVVRIAQSPRR
jgi:hypothetical protein